MVPALRLNEQFEASAGYWTVGGQTPQEVQQAITSEDGDELLDALDHYQFSNLQDSLGSFDYKKMARRLKLPKTPQNSYVCANFEVLSTISPNLTFRAPARNGTSFNEPARITAQRLLISWVPPGGKKKTGDTTELAKLLIAEHS